MAAVAVVKNKPVLTLVDLASKKGVNVYPREGNQVVDLWWVNDRRVLYTEGTRVSGFDQPMGTGEIFAVNADGSSPQLLFGYRAGGASGASAQVSPERATGKVVDVLPDDENHVLISVDSWDAGVDGDFTKLYVLDVRNGLKKKVGVAPIRNAQFASDQNGVARFAFGYDTHANLQLYYREGDNKPWALLEQGSLTKAIPVPQSFTRDNSHVYMTCQVPGKVGALCLWDVATQKMGEPVWTHDTVTASDLVNSLDKRDVVGVYATPGLPTAQAIVPDADAIKAIGQASRQLPGESVVVVSSTRDGRKAIMLASSDMDPGTYYLWDVETAKLTPLLERAGWIKPANMAATRPIQFKARDGLTIHGYLSLPPGKEQAKHLPMVVFVHGGPFWIRDDWGYDPYVQMLATQGYAVLQVNFRGSGGYGQSFMQSGFRQWGGTMQDDITDATRWAIEQNIASRDRICIFGGSYGGYAALEGAMKEPDLYRCAIGYVGVYDLPLHFKQGDTSKLSMGSAYLRATMGTDMTALAARSPVNQLDSLKASVMLIVGGKDERVPPIQGQSLHDALLKRNIAHEWIYKPNEGHGFYDEANVAELMQRMVQFLDRHIGNGLASDNAKGTEAVSPVHSEGSGDG